MNAIVRLEPPIMPRDDQNDALAIVLDALNSGMQRPLIEAPCGWGKSILDRDADAANSSAAADAC